MTARGKNINHKGGPRPIALTHFPANASAQTFGPARRACVGLGLSARLHARLKQGWLLVEQPVRQHIDHLRDDGERRRARTAGTDRRLVHLRVHLSQQHRRGDRLAVGDLQLRAAVRADVVLVDVGKDDAHVHCR